MTTVDLRFGDCLAVLRQLPDESVSAVVTDPPYGLAEHKPAALVTALTAWANGDRDHVPDGKGFMGREWDAFVPPPAVWDECLRVLKPGGHLLAFAGSRTADLMGLSVRMAGFEIRDTIMWVYGSGFPKSLDVSKAIDATLLHGGANSRRLKASNAEREVVGPKLSPDGKPASSRRVRSASNNGLLGEQLAANPDVNNETTPATPAAEQWQGWGTALKPAQEPIIVARKPLTGPVAANVLAHGTGGLNVDACRVAAPGEVITNHARGAASALSKGIYGNSTAQETHQTPGQPAGRWPANVVLSHVDTCEDGGACADGCPVAELDRQSGTLKSGAIAEHHRRTTAGGNGETHGAMRGVTGPVRPADEGGASRFFAQFRYSADDQVFFPIESVLCGDGLTRGASTSAGRKTGSSDGSSPIDGSGSRPTAPSPTGTRSITGTTTRSTTTSTISCASPQSGTTTTTSGSASSTAGSTASSNAGVSDVTSGSPSRTTTSDGRGPGRATAVPASGPTDASGSPATGTPSTPADETGTPEDCPPEFFPTFRYQAKAPARERPKIDGKGWPTVKPLALMRWLVRLVTPPGGVVLDPFAGTGSTLQAARDEGFASIGVERDEFAYLLACRRLGLPELVPATVTDAETGEPVALPEVAAEVEVPGESVVEQLPEPTDPVLAAIAAASSYDELLVLWREHRWGKDSDYNTAAAARRAELEVAA